MRVSGRSGLWECLVGVACECLGVSGLCECLVGVACESVWD